MADALAASADADTKLQWCECLACAVCGFDEAEAGQPVERFGDGNRAEAAATWFLKADEGACQHLGQVGQLAG